MHGLRRKGEKSKYNMTDEYEDLRDEITSHYRKKKYDLNEFTVLMELIDDCEKDDLEVDEVSN